MVSAPAVRDEVVQTAWPLESATVAATICYAGAAIFSRGFKGLDPMAPAAGSLLCGADASISNPSSPTG